MIPIPDIDERVRRLPFKHREYVREALENAEWFAAHPPAPLPPDFDISIAGRKHLRGVSTWELVAELQELEGRTDKWVLLYAERISEELRRRSDFTISEKAQANQHEIRALKELCLGEDFVNTCAHYAEVKVAGGAWNFGCRLHGDGLDRNLSGHLYPTEGKWWCYGCNKGGDVFSFLMTYGRLTFQEAVGLLKRLYGLTGRGNGG